MSEKPRFRLVPPLPSPKQHFTLRAAALLAQSKHIPTPCRLPRGAIVEKNWNKCKPVHSQIDNTYIPQSDSAELIDISLNPELNDSSPPDLHNTIPTGQGETRL